MGLHHVTRGARHFVHNGARLATQHVEQRGLPRVGGPPQHHACAFQHAARTVMSTQQAVKAFCHVQRHGPLCGHPLGRKSVVREVQVGLGLRQQRKHTFPQRFQRAGQHTFPQARGRHRRLRGLCRQQRRHGLGLVQAEPPVQKRAQGKLAGHGLPRAATQHRIQQPGSIDAPTHSVQLHARLAGERAGPAKGHTQRLHGNTRAVDVTQVHHAVFVWPTFVLHKHAVPDLHRRRPADAHHVDDAVTTAGEQRGNGVLALQVQGGHGVGGCLYPLAAAASAVTAAHTWAWPGRVPARNAPDASRSVVRGHRSVRCSPGTVWGVRVTASSAAPPPRNGAVHTPRWRVPTHTAAGQIHKPPTPGAAAGPWPDVAGWNPRPARPPAANTG